MATLTLTDITKAYNQHVVVDDFNVEVKEGEFVTLLGPSGCGKTTTLRMVAGFVEPTTGTILINNEPVFSNNGGINLPPEKREMGMVFQSYAVWPHMSVRDNVAYPLKFKKMSGEQVNSKVQEVLEIVNLAGYESRMPDQLSGGQQQRVALARALAMEPKVLLLDEPLSNLDSKLRESMRGEIVELQKRLGITVLYVTHDQTEAMSMSDRIIVMSQGKIKQIGSPQEIYESPADLFVAGFIGTANFLPGVVESCGDGIAQVRVQTEREGGQVVAGRCRAGLQAGEAVTMVVRQEEVSVSHDDVNGLEAKVTSMLYMGNKYELNLKIGGATLNAIVPHDAHFQTGQTVYLHFDDPFILKE